MMSGPLTIAFQVFATSWLGHTSRLIAIAQGIRRQRPEARLIFLVEGNSGPLLESAGFPHVSLPHESAFAGPEWGGWPVDQRDRMLGAMTRTLLEQLAPRVIVFDSRPCAYMADEAAQLQIPTVFVARRTRTASRCFEWAVAHQDAVDLVIAPHEAGEFPVPDQIQGKTHFVGTIVRDATQTSAARAPQPGKHALITGGGGGFPGTVDYYNQALAAVGAARARVPSLRGTLVTGPMFGDWQKLQPVEGVTIIPFDPDLQATMAAADVVICQAGYNTIAELGELGTPTICMPAPRIADDQFARARSIAEQRSAFFVLTDCTTEALRDQIIACLDTPRGQPGAASRAAGADRAAKLILDLCA
jgi:predicted glycosyltransferase